VTSGSASGRSARVVQHSELADGRFATTAVGLRRVRVERWLDDDPYPRAEVVELPEAPWAPTTMLPACAWSTR